MDLASIRAGDILAHRPPRIDVDPGRPVGMFVEGEYAREGKLERVATLLLAARECARRCLMCDLWRHTLPGPTPRGAIPAQIDYALERLEPAESIKLYNSGSFLDRASIPIEDHGPIADRVRAFRTVVVENHPKCRIPEFRAFRRRIEPARLEVAMGLETVHAPSLRALRKGMTAGDFRRSAEWLRSDGASVRAFILVRPPGLDEAAGIEWAVRSAEFAFESAADTVVLIPTRAGNGIMDRLAERGLFEPPRLTSLETALERSLRLGRGRAFADLWAIERLRACSACRADRVARLRAMNETQEIGPNVVCVCDGRSQKLAADRIRRPDHL